MKENIEKLINLPITGKGILDDISNIIEHGRHQAYAAAGQIVIATYWNVGRRIVEEEQHGEERAKYGTKLIAELAKKLTPTFGNNYGKRNLQHYRKFYILFPDFGKVYEFVHNLNWTHIRRLLSENKKRVSHLVMTHPFFGFLFLFFLLLFDAEEIAPAVKVLLHDQT